MKTYGSIKYSVADAPQPIAGICENYNYKSSDQVLEVPGEDGAIAAVVLHGRKGEITFSSTPEATVTALGVRAGAELTITGISAGKIVVMQSSAKWQRGQAMTMDASATHFPDIDASAVGTLTLATLTLAKGTGALVLPTDKVWFSTHGLESPVASGIVQSCQISESVQAQEEEDAEGKIVAVALYGYKATASMEILTAGAAPEVGDTLDAFGSFRVTSVDEKWSKGAMRSILLEGLLVPGVTS